MLYCITVLPRQQNIQAEAGLDLLQVLRSAGLGPDAPCGGMGRCGKCKVMVDGREVVACRTIIDRDMVVTLPQTGADGILTDSIKIPAPVTLGKDGCLLALDIGTTTLAGYLLDGKTGRQLACHSMYNPQGAFGADVISRIGHALNGYMEALTAAVREGIERLTLELCRQAGVDPARICLVSPVGNPAMQQLFLGITPQNLAQIPFAPMLTQSEVVSAAPYLPVCSHADMLIVPDISGFVGADTVACVLATALDQQEQNILLVDIGTNGEMVLGNRHHMAACSTAAGPALEGANIHFGMRGQDGAIDHVWIENGKIRCSVIGNGKAVGICGSGLIDAVAVALEQNLLNERGRILTEDRLLHLTDAVFLTQEDIRQVQMAKGAIAAGIEQLAAYLHIGLQEIDRVYLAGAFGTFMDPASACRIGLLPAVLAGKIRAVGNAAGSGAKLLACDGQQLHRVQQLISKMAFIELASVPGFARSFAKNMRF